VQNEEDGGAEEEYGLYNPEYAERDGVRLVHGPRIKRGLVARVPEYYRYSTAGGAKQPRSELRREPSGLSRVGIGCYSFHSIQ
jgi:hypothetical protein